MFGDLLVKRFLQSGEEESQCGWCVVSSFASVCLSVCLSLSLSLSRSSGLWTVVCLLSIWPRCREICLLYHFSLLIGSNWVFFGFFFLLGRSRIGRKITFNNFNFLTNFIDISLCADPMRRTPFFFPFWRKSRHR